MYLVYGTYRRLYSIKPSQPGFHLNTECKCRRQFKLLLAIQVEGQSSLHPFWFLYSREGVGGQRGRALFLSEWGEAGVWPWDKFWCSTLRHTTTEKYTNKMQHKSFAWNNRPRQWRWVNDPNQTTLLCVNRLSSTQTCSYPRQLQILSIHEQPT